MKKILSIFMLSATLLVLGGAYAAADASMDVRIDYRFNTVKEDYKYNYFNWRVGKNPIVKDKFDAVSGASLKGSTKAFNSVRYSGPAEEKKAAMPSGLRALFLFAIADWKMAEANDLQITNEAGVITVRFIRKTSAYEIKTDKKGNFDLLTGSKCAKDIAEKTENGFSIKPEYLKEGGDPSKMSDLDWSKINLVEDTFNPEASDHYEGTLKFAFKKGVLTVNGTMMHK